MRACNVPDIYLRARYDGTMLGRFFWICILWTGCVSGCSKEPSDEVPPKNVPCPSLKLAKSAIQFDIVERWLPTLKLESPPQQALVQRLKTLSQKAVWTYKDHQDIRAIALRYTQRHTLKHFVDLGRRLAWTSVSDIWDHPKRLDRLTIGLTPEQSRQVLGHIVGQTPPKITQNEPHAMLIRYVLSLQAWTSLLNRKLQLSNWWTSFEYRWLLEATALGYQNVSLNEQWASHKKLVQIPEYPFAQNDIILSLWSGNFTTPQRLSSLNLRVPIHCIESYKK